MKHFALLISILFCFGIKSIGQYVDTVFTQARINGEWSKNPDIDIATLNENCEFLSGKGYIWVSPTFGYEKSYRSKDTYDSAGNLIEYFTQNSVNNEWKNDYRSLYSYSSNGLDVAELTQSWSNNEWVPSLKSHYQYNNDGEIVSSEFYFYVSNEWEKLDRSIYYYDSKNRLIKTIWQEGENNQW
jgi:hypothetical protein